MGDRAGAQSGVEILIWSRWDNIENPYSYVVEETWTYARGPLVYLNVFWSTRTCYRLRLTGRLAERRRWRSRGTECRRRCRRRRRRRRCRSRRRRVAGVANKFNVINSKVKGF